MHHVVCILGRNNNNYTVYSLSLSPILCIHMYIESRKEIIKKSAGKEICINFISGMHVYASFSLLYMGEEILNSHYRTRHFYPFFFFFYCSSLFSFFSAKIHDDAMRQK